MGLFSRNKKQVVSNNPTSTSLLNIFSPSFSNMSSPEANILFNSICQTHAKHISKIQLTAFRGDEKPDRRNYLNRLLTLRPNPNMNGSIFWETAMIHYYQTNNVFIYLEWDYTLYRTPLKNLWLLDENAAMQVIPGDTEEDTYVKFTLNKESVTTNIANIVHLSRNVNPSTFFGRKNKAIQQVLRVIQTNYEGIEQAVKSSSFIRFILQSTTPISEEKKKERAQYFADTYLGKDSSGVVYLDNASTIQQVTSNPKYADADLLGILRKDIYEYLGCNEKITTANYNEQEFQAYYQSTLEPFIIKLERELTYKIYSNYELYRDNQIKVKVDKLDTASLTTRIKIAQTYQKQPVFIPNVVNELLYLPESDKGDKEFSNLNYVQTKVQNEYQVGHNLEGDEEDDTGS